MLRLFKKLVSHETLPPHVHFHVDDHGNQVWCDESVCHPARRPSAALLPPRW